MEEQDHLRTLLRRYADNTATEYEQQQLFSLITASADEELESSLTSILETTQPSYDEARRQRILNKLLKEISQSNGRVIAMKKKWIRWTVAACVILLLGIATYVILGRIEGRHKEQQVATIHDVPAPTNTRAVITLADGSKVYLDSAGNGILARQNNVKVIRNGKGEIVYEGSPDHPITKSPDIAYNTLYNPRGSKVISLTLSDGTKVWLNSESSLRYPASFALSALNREVEITGEAYFEVRHNAKQPFKVHLPNGSIVEDIGTSFNVNAYPDEEAIKTTLIEGSVKLTAANAAIAAVKLKPGQQLLQSPDHQITTSPNIDEVIAWKSGWFDFDNVTLPTIMRQLSRWYNIDVVYETSPTSETYGGRISKDLPLSNVLHSLEANGAKFKIEGKKITVIK